MVSSLFGGVGGYVGDLNSFGASEIDVGDIEACEVSTRWRLTSSLTKLESRLDEPELVNDWRGSWLAVELRRDRGGEERGIESCEAVSASSSSDSRDTLRGSEFVGEGGGKIPEVMIDEVEGDFLSQGNYVITVKLASTHLSPAAAMPIGVYHLYPLQL